MSVKEANLTVVVSTLCLAFLAWGTVIVLRVVVDQNYHAPTAAQQALSAYQNCVQYGGSNSGDCKALAEKK